MSTHRQRSQHATVAKAEQMSVSELRAWLFEFGEKSRDHFEKNQVMKTPSSFRRNKMHPFDGPALSFSSSGSTSVASPPQASTKALPSEVQKPRSDEEATKLNLGPEPVFREFDAEENLFDLDFFPEESNALHDLVDNYRVLSILKVIDAPPPPMPARSGGIFPWDEEDDFSDPWASFSMRPKVSRHYSVTDAKAIFSMEHDTSSVATGRITDPGVFPHERVKAESLKDDSTKTRSIRNKLPLLTCKSHRGDDRLRTTYSTRGDLLVQTSAATNGNGKDIPVTSCSFEPLFHEHSFTKVASFFLSHSKDDQNKNIYNLPDQDDEVSTLSLFTDDNSQTFCYPETDKELIDTAKMEDVFTEQLNQESKNHISLLEVEPFHAPTNHPQGQSTACTRGARSSSHRWTQAPALSLATKPTTSGFNPEIAMKAPAPCNKPSFTSGIHTVVARFGGKPNRLQKQSAVQLRREQLEQKWASERTPAEGMSRKITWQASDGRYKKRVVLDYADRKFL